jgi:hypothetical protein
MKHVLISGCSPCGRGWWALFAAGAILVASPLATSCGSVAGEDSTVSTITNETEEPTTEKMIPSTTLTGGPDTEAAAPMVDWPGEPPPGYVLTFVDRIEHWQAEQLVATVVPDILLPGQPSRPAFFADGVIYYGATDVWAIPPPFEGDDGASSSSGAAVAGGYLETQVRLADVARIDSQLSLVIESIESFNFGDEATAEPAIPPRSLWLYPPDGSTAGRRVVIDVPNRAPDLTVQEANATLTHVSVGGDTLLIAFEYGDKRWLEAYRLDGSEADFDLPGYDEATSDEPKIGAVAPDGSTIAIVSRKQVVVHLTGDGSTRSWPISDMPNAVLFEDIDYDGDRLAVTVRSPASGRRSLFLSDVTLERHTFVEIDASISFERS